ncbi:MAG: allophanate hydrolase [Pseudomonadota bacterium]
MNETDLAAALVAAPINRLSQAYQKELLTPFEVCSHIVSAADLLATCNIWVTPPSLSQIEPYLRALEGVCPTEKALWGIPFAVKDNIDVVGMPTSAGCPEFTYTPERSAEVVQRLVDAGAIPVGKTNLDQFATGLVGTRSPYGVTKHPDRPEMISGGSSSGSAVAVSTGLVSFALGTDTAGSGRVPAALNKLVGYKPTRGLISNSGVVPACRSIDCVSILTRNVQDAAAVAGLSVAFDPSDANSRVNHYPNDFSHFGIWDSKLSLGVIEQSQLEFFGDDRFASAYADTIDQLQRAGVQLQTIDFAPFMQAALELYEGPWVTERYLAAESIIRGNPNALLPVTLKVIEAGATSLGCDVYRSQYKLAELRMQCVESLRHVDALLTPTVGCHYSIEEVLNKPFLTNTNLGYYTNYMNLLDMCGVAVPGAHTPDGEPFGVTLVGDRLSDTQILSIGAKVTRLLDASSEASGSDSVLSTFQQQNSIDIAVCGAHMSGLPLNWQLTQRRAQLIKVAATAKAYRLFALSGGPPKRPGMMKDSARGDSIAIEIWRMPAESFASFLEGIPWPLGIGRVELDDGTTVAGFVCESAGLEGAEEITHHRSWRSYITS